MERADSRHKNTDKTKGKGGLGWERNTNKTYGHEVGGMFSMVWVLQEDTPWVAGEQGEEGRGAALPKHLSRW